MAWLAISGVGRILVWGRIEAPRGEVPKAPSGVDAGRGCPSWVSLSPPGRVWVSCPLPRKFLIF